MDALLAITSVFLATSLPVPATLMNKEESSLKNDGIQKETPEISKNSKKARKFIRAFDGDAAIVQRLVLFFSLCLFSLSVLEAVPNGSSFFLFLVIDEENIIYPGKHSFVYASVLYKAVLWVECILVAIVAPAMCGGSLFLSSFQVEKNVYRTKKNPTILKLKDTENDFPEEKHINVSTEQHPVIIFNMCHILQVLYQSTKTLVVLIMVYLKYSCLRVIKVTKPYICRRRNDMPSLAPTLGKRSKLKMRNQEGILKHRMRQLCFNKTNASLLSPWQLLIMLSGIAIGLLISYVTLNYFGSMAKHRPSFVSEEGATEVQNKNTIFLQLLVKELCAIGMIISFIMDGFGSVALPHAFLVGFVFDNVSEESIQCLESEYNSVRKATEEKIDSYDERNYKSHQEDKYGTGRRNSRSWIWNKLSSDDNKHVLEKSPSMLKIQNEIDTMQELAIDLLQDLKDAKEIKALSDAANSRLGKCKEFLGSIFSLILLVRLSGAIWTLLFGHKDSHHHDLITSIVIWLVQHRVVDKAQYTSISQFLSLLLSAFFSVSQVRKFLQVVGLLSRRLRNVSFLCFHLKNRSNRIERVLRHQGAFLSCVTFFMGCYYISCITLIKGNLPLSYQKSFSKALGGIRFEFVPKIRLYIFTFSAALSSFMFGIVTCLKKSIAKRQAVMMNEKIYIMEEP